MARGNRRRDRAAQSRFQRFLGIGQKLTAEQFGKPLWVEQLEDRRMLATFTVINLNDLVFQGGEWVVAGGSLRAAVNAANDNDEADTIIFADTLSGTIQLDGRDIAGQLTIEDDLTIAGPGTRKISISAAGNRRAFQIEQDENDPFGVSISGLTITNGTAPGGTDENAGQGGAILNLGNLSLTEVAITNSRATYGGGILNAGNLNIERSLISNNQAFTDGGGIHNGVPVEDDDSGSTDDGPRPATSIINSTITGNRASTGNGYGGGLFNRDGNLDVVHCTIVNNSAYLGSGIGSWGNALPEAAEEGEEPGPPPPPTIYTTVSGTVLFHNNNTEDSPGDIDVVGMSEPEDEESEPEPLLPSINIKFEDDNIVAGGDVGGNNLIHTPGLQVEGSDGDIAPGTDPLFISDDEGDPILADYGGSTNTYHPFYDETGTLPNSPLIDHYERNSGSYDVRGRHFTRVYDFDPLVENPRIDVGAVEVQHGVFVVDTIADEADDKQYSDLTDITAAGDFVMREALNFSKKNPLVDTIIFDLAGQTDPTPSPALTFLITLRDSQNKLMALPIDHSVNIVGPTNYRLEFDGNNPPTPVDGDGTRIFNITDGSATAAVDVSISNLFLLGADANGSGGAILNRENLTLNNMTLQGNRATLDGGAIHHDLGTLTINSSTISGNNSSDDGAIYIAQSSGSVLISNSTISGNVASDRGGGLFNRGTDTNIEFSTIVNNTAGSTIGSGVYSQEGNVSFYSTILWANLINDVAGLSASTVTSDGYNLVGSRNAAVRNNFSDGAPTNDVLPTGLSPTIAAIGLAPLGFAGGLTQTHAIVNDVVVNGKSILVNRGPESPTNPPEFDQRGKPFERIFDGKEDSVDELRIDIGSYELQGRVYRVDNPGDVSDGNYGAGQLTLREAIELANLGPLFDFIEFDDMVLGANPEISPNGALTISDDVLIQWQGSTPLTLRGSGTVFAISDGTTNVIDVEIKGGDRGINEFVLQGRNITSTENLILRVVDILGNNSSAITHQVGSLEIYNTILTGNISTVSGGAINAQNASRVYIYDSSLTGNSTAFTNGHGGGIYLKNTPFEGNLVVIANNVTASGASDGAGIFIDNSGLPTGADKSVKFHNSVISGNSTVGANSDGGGIFARGANVYLSDYTTLALNTTFGTNSRGGAIYINGGGVLTISDNVTLTFNRTIGQFSHGGAIANVGGTVNIDATDVSNNSTNGADAHGGAIYVENGTLSVVDSSLVDNKTNGLRSDGGAIYSNTSLTGAKTTILNSTISGNSTKDHGGGIYNADGLTVIKYSTITNNSAPYFGFGAGVGSFGSIATTRTEVGSSIIAGNKASGTLPGTTPSDVDRINGSFQDTFVSLGYNVIGTGISAAFTGATNDLAGVLDPGLEDLTFNGGPSRTHALKEDSPAVNRGKPSIVAGVNGVPEFDQRGEARIKNGRIDIGAYESDFTSALPGDFDGDGVVNGRDFLAWQRNPSVGSLSDWKANYGTGSLVAAVVTTEDVSEPLVASVMADDSDSVATVVSPAVVAAAQATSSGSAIAGWVTLPANVSTPAKDATDETSLDIAYLAAFSEGFEGVTIAESANDFGDIATCRSVENGDDVLAEDAVFDLIGAGEF
jgi:hypothetical protein